MKMKQLAVLVISALLFGVAASAQDKPAKVKYVPAAKYKGIKTPKAQPKSPEISTKDYSTRGNKQVVTVRQHQRHLAKERRREKKMNYFLSRHHEKKMKQPTFSKSSQDIRPYSEEVKQPPVK